MNEYSFKKGMQQVPVGKIREVKEMLKAGLGVKSATGLHARITGKIEPKVSEFKFIEDVFMKLGIKDIWGE